MDELKLQTQIKSKTVDKTLVAMFLKISPEERIESNNNAILELRKGFKNQQTQGSPSQRAD